MISEEHSRTSLDQAVESGGQGGDVEGLKDNGGLAITAHPVPLRGEAHCLQKVLGGEAAPLVLTIGFIPRLNAVVTFFMVGFSQPPVRTPDLPQDGLVLPQRCSGP